MDGTRLPDQDGTQAAPLADAAHVSIRVEPSPPVDATAQALAVQATLASRVMVFRRDLLPLSETFVRQQALGLRGWQALMVGHRFVPDGLDLSGLVAFVVGPNVVGFVNRLAWTVFRYTGWPASRAVRTLLATRPRLIHVHFATDAVAAWPWLEHCDLPIVVTLHGYDVTIRPEYWAAGHEGAAQRDYPARLRALASEPRVSFIAVSEAIHDALATSMGLEAVRFVAEHFSLADCTAALERYYTRLSHRHPR